MSGQKGFTLLELLVVLTLVVVIVGMVAVNMGLMLPKERLKASVRDIVSLTRYAKNRAQIEGRKAEVVFDLTERTISFRNRRKTLPEDIEVYLITPDGYEVRDDSYRMVFYPGYGCSGGRIVLRTGERGYSISLDPITCTPEVERAG